MWRLRLLVALVIPIVCLRPAEAVDRPENLAWATAFGADDDAGTGAGTLLSVAGHGNVLEMENSDAGQAVSAEIHERHLSEIAARFADGGADLPGGDAGHRRAGAHGASQGLCT